MIMIIKAVISNGKNKEVQFTAIAAFKLIAVTSNKNNRISTDHMVEVKEQLLNLGHLVDKIIV